MSTGETYGPNIANDAEMLNVVICSLSERNLLLINRLSCTDANLQHSLSILKGEYLDMDDIIDRLFQHIIDYTPKRIAYFDLENITPMTSSIVIELAGSSFFFFFTSLRHPQIRQRSTDGQTTIPQFPR